ncbi:hypothetical protein DdX_19782 [Ditylenchus destructor]|uniref:Carboxypeptidase regulatory-like domain-containing protein n=1 Tax=Ditylenchus destructor TaxID=166010 RepID=A0AAD4MHD0_9BILA|nr:hypothetical protein DdX_19782 [Ditylenchus destructor]
MPAKERKFEFRRVVFERVYPTFPETNVDIDYPTKDITYEPKESIYLPKDDSGSPEIESEDEDDLMKKKKKAPEGLPGFAEAHLTAIYANAEIKATQLGPIKGKLVKGDGSKPYAGESIQLETLDGETMTGKTDDQGRYTFMYHGAAGPFILRYGVGFHTA